MSQTKKFYELDKYIPKKIAVNNRFVTQSLYNDGGSSSGGGTSSNTLPSTGTTNTNNTNSANASTPTTPQNSNAVSPNVSANPYEEWYQKSLELLNQYYGAGAQQRDETYAQLRDASDKYYAEQLAALQQQLQTAESSRKESYQQQIAELQRQRDASAQLLQYARNASQEEAYVLRQRAAKYLPKYMAAQGLDGSGVDFASMVGIDNNYSNRLGKIGSDYSSNLSALEQAYGQQKANADASKLSDLSALQQAYLQNRNTAESNHHQDVQKLLESQYSDKKSDEQKRYEETTYLLDQYANWQKAQADADAQGAAAAFDSGFSQLLNDEHNYDVNNQLTSDGRKKALDYLESNKDVLGQQTYAAWKSLIDMMSSNNALNGGTTSNSSSATGSSSSGTTASAEFKNTHTGVVFNNNGFADGHNFENDNFSVRDANGNKYRVKADNKVEIDQITNLNLRQIADEVAEGDVFGYNDCIYMKKDGYLILIVSRVPTAIRAGDYDKLYELIFGKQNSAFK